MPCRNLSAGALLVPQPRLCDLSCANWFWLSGYTEGHARAWAIAQAHFYSSIGRVPSQAHEEAFRCEGAREGGRPPEDRPHNILARPYSL